LYSARSVARQVEPERTSTERSGLPWLTTRAANQYRDAPSLIRKLSGPGTLGLVAALYEIDTTPSTGLAILANASLLRSMWPGAHSGHWSMIRTRTLPLGPVTSRYPPQAAPAEYSDGPSAT
jgi:hypothetical protein